MMYIDPKKKLDLSSAHFDEMRRDLDRYITKMLPIMEAKNTQAGTISLKIDFSILEDKVKCENSPTGEREALIPTINYKIAMTLQSKAENKGYVVSGGHEVVQEGSDYYIVTKEEAGGQLNMFDSSRACSFGGATSPDASFGCQSGAAGTSAQALRFRCVNSYDELPDEEDVSDEDELPDLDGEDDE